MENTNEMKLETLPRFVLDTYNMDAVVACGTSDHALTFALEVPEVPYTLMYAPKSEYTLGIAANIGNFTPPEDADAFVFFFKRTTFGTIDANVRGVLAISHAADQVTGGAANRLVGQLLDPLLKVMRGLNAWLQTGDTYAEYLAMDTGREMMELTEADGALSTRVLTGKNRPDLQCYDFDLFAFGDSEAIVSCRPYADEEAEALSLEGLSLEDKVTLADLGDTMCMENLAMLYLNGDDSTPADPAQAFTWMQRLAEAGVDTGMFNLGLFYAKGFGTSRDFAKAAEWMEKALEAGDEDAEASAKQFRAMAENLPKAEAGNASAQAGLAKDYMRLSTSLDQAGPDADLRESFAWAQKAAEQNSPEGIWVLALAYEHGRGVEPDEAKAAEYYRRGAELGHPECMCSYGARLMEDAPSEEDEKRAFQLFEKAAEAGCGNAMANLGKCWQFANGCPGNMKKACEWYEKAGEALDDDELREKASFFRMIGESGKDWGRDYDEEPEDPEDFDGEPEDPDPDAETAAEDLSEDEDARDAESDGEDADAPNREPDFGGDEPAGGPEDLFNDELLGFLGEEFLAIDAYHDRLERAGLFPDDPHGYEAFEADFPRVRHAAEAGDEKARQLLDAWLACRRREALRNNQG